MSKLRPHLTYANVMVTILAFIVLGGTAWALARNTVGSPQIKSDAVKNPEIAHNAVKSPEVADGSLLGVDFAAGQLPAGPPGEQGLEGDPGPVTGVLPSGTSEKGTFVARNTDNEGPDHFDTAISFPLTLPAGVPAFYLSIAAPPTFACSGSAATPTAAPGNLCVYEALKSANVVSASFVDPVTTTATTTTRPFGVIFRGTPNAVGDTYIYGSWAVTAP